MGALAGAERDQAAGQPRGATVGFGVGDALAVAHQQRMVAADATTARAGPGPASVLPGMLTGGGEMSSDRAHVGLARRCPGDGVDDRDLGGNLVAAPTGVRRNSTSSSGSADAPVRNSTMATGVSPSRSSGRPTTAAPCTAGWLSSAARTSSGITLNPPRMMAWSARPRIHRKPSASMRARSVVRIQSVDATQLARLHLQQPTRSVPNGVPSSSTTRSCAPSVARPTLPRLACQYFW